MSPGANEPLQVLSEFRGQPLVLYFYPRDDTPSCTEEAKGFSCLIDEFTKAGISVVGVSPDTERSHERFAHKHDLKHRLVSDADRALAEAYGVWIEKTMYGRTFMGVERATFLIGPTGRIEHIWRKVRVKGHAEAVLTAARGQ